MYKVKNKFYMYIFIYKYIHIDGNLGRVKAPNELKH